MAFFGPYLPRKESVEPARLRQAHGDAYDRYFRAVPALIPRLAPYSEAKATAWSAPRMLHNREHWMVIGLLVAVAWLWVRQAP